MQKLFLRAVIADIRVIALLNSMDVSLRSITILRASVSISLALIIMSVVVTTSVPALPHVPVSQVVLLVMLVLLIPVVGVMLMYVSRSVAVHLCVPSPLTELAELLPDVLKHVWSVKAIMRILVIRPTAIGDSILTFPVLRALREKYTNTHLTLTGNSAILPLAKEWGIAEEVYGPDDIPWIELYFSETGISQKFLRDLVQQVDYTICWVPFRNIEEFVTRNLLNTGAKELSVARGFTIPGMDKHTVDYLAETVGLQDFDWKSLPPITMKSNGLCLYNAPVAIHPGCSTLDRTWAAKSFAAVINHLLHLQQPVLLLAGPMDDETLKSVQKHISPSPRPGMLTILKNAPLLEVVRQIKQCKCYLGNDSGITHLAALLNIPTTALFMSCYVPYTHPIGASVEVIQEESLEEISVERVLATIQKYL